MGEAKQMRATIKRLGLMAASLPWPGFIQPAAADAISPDSFLAPPRACAPYVWWHWMNGNIDKDGLTADLEALAENGLAGAMFFDASCKIPKGPVTFGTEEFFDMVRHAAHEAKRLGLTLGVANCSGWANSGGPWVTPAESMKFTTVSETPVSGPARFEGTLPRTADDHGFYADIAVLAVRGADRQLPAEVVTTGNVTTVTVSEPVTAAGFSWRVEFPWHWHKAGSATVEVSEDGQAFRTVETMPFRLSYFNTQFANLRRHTFTRPLTFKALRFTVRCDGGWKADLKEFRLECEQRLEDIDAKKLRYKMPIRPTALTEERDVLKAENVLDITDKMDASGRLVWDAPPGDWTVLRIGYCANGRLVSWSGTEAGRGPEVDKLAAAPVERHFEAYVGKLKRILGGDSDVLTMVLNDSFEAGSQNWTQGFEHEFARRKGYSLLPFLPVFTGRIVGSVAESEKFLADYRSVINDLFAENYARTLQRKAHEYGMTFYLEPYGNGPSDDFTYSRYCDVPMAEFWSEPNVDRFCLSTGPILGSVEDIVPRADNWGQSIVAAEAFTAGDKRGRWQIYPYSLKCQCDNAYRLGVNQIFYHRFTHQPWKTPRYPGMTMGPWGMHFDRTQTWWTEAAEFVRYQTRCQYLLQQGEKVKDDVCHRRKDGADWYFITSTNHVPTTVEKSCAVTGLQPEIWYPETGEAVRAARWRVENGRTIVTVDLPAAGSAFVVFRKAASDLPVERRLTERVRRAITGPWQVRFSCPAGGEPQPRELGLDSWTNSADRALKYFSGSAFYRRTVDLPRPLASGERLVLDLGDVRDFATPTVNGRTFRPLWKPPFELDVTDALAPGATSFSLEVKVTNRWPNRLIGDDFLPEGERRTWTSWKHWTKDDSLLESGWLGPACIRILSDTQTL